MSLDLFLESNPRFYLKVMGAWLHISLNYRKSSILNKDEIRNQLSISRNMLNRIFSYLHELGVVEKVIIRHNGKIAGTNTLLKLKLTY